MAGVDEILAKYAQAAQGRSFADPTRLRAGLQTSRDLTAAGVTVPDGYEMDIRTGQLHKTNDGGFLDAPAWAWALPAAGATLGMSLAATAPAAGASAAASAAPAATTGGGGMFGGLLGGLTKFASNPLVQMASKGLGAFAQGQAQNRGAQFGGQLDLEALLMARDAQFQNQQIQREQEGRAGSSDAIRKLIAMQHLTNPGARPQLSPYSVAPRQATGMERQGADALTQEVMARLMGGNPIPQVQQRPLSVDPNLLRSGWLEQIAGIASPALGVLGAMGKK